VGDTFLTIHPGSPSAASAQTNSILQGKPALSISDLMTHGLGVMDDADASMKAAGERQAQHVFGWR
jgi:phospholipid/cholesterol/gamma-HCH transport system substrate-binding protein